MFGLLLYVTKPNMIFLHRIKVNYPGRADELSLHSGFALYLMRKRKDTGQSKLEEIFDKVDAIGREMDPSGNYKL